MKARLILLCACGLALWAAPPLTTIQDVLYKADGTPFSGFLEIQWKSFEASDTSQIATHGLRVPILGGVLRVQLVPTTNAMPTASYSVRYNSDGKIQFEETWAVPPSNTPLRVRDVRVAGPPGPITPPPLTEVPESDVIGLVADLAARPVKGAGYAPSRAAYIDASGALEAVAGNLGDCVRVDGTAGPCGTGGTPGPGFVDDATPAGLINGSNTVFTLADAPSPASSAAVYRNGLLQKQGVDYTVSDNVLTFAAASIPQPGDSLSASYRLADAANPVGQAGGALSGTYPNPALALAVVADANVSDIAGIRESKLALNYPTHSSANDPTANQKAGLAGTAGTPSGTNRYVTEQDTRLTDARPPAGHALLSAGHLDTSAAAPARGDLVVAQGATSTSWKRLPLGAPNRCLMSNGSDAVWNTCLYTGFAEGSLPFVDASGSLAQNNTRLVWNNTNRKLSVGNNAGTATLYLYDALPATGSTSLTVRAGQGQAEPLQRWLDGAAAELARVESDGRFWGTAYRGASSSVRAAWQDAGAGADPSGRSDGDLWYNTASQARKTVEGGQTHALPQVLCGDTGTATSATGLTTLGSCTVPASLLQPGDRVEIRFDYAHAGTGTGFWFEVRWGGTTLAGRNGDASESLVSGRAEAGIHGAGAQWSLTNWGAVTAFAAGVGNATDALDAPLTIGFLGRMAGGSTETLTLRCFSVVRYPKP